MTTTTAGMGEVLLVSPREAAKLLGVSPRKLWDVTFNSAAGEGLPYVRIGRLVRYSPAELRAWIARQARQGGCDNGDAT